MIEKEYKINFGETNVEEMINGIFRSTCKKMYS